MPTSPQPTRTRGTIRGQAESGSTLSSAYAPAHVREKSLKNFPWKCPDASYPKSVNGGTWPTFKRKGAMSEIIVQKTNDDGSFLAPRAPRVN
jgi:hypothetical protein